MEKIVRVACIHREEDVLYFSEDKKIFKLDSVEMADFLARPHTENYHILHCYPHHSLNIDHVEEYYALFNALMECKDEEYLEKFNKIFW